MPWQVLPGNSGILAVHAALLGNGKILYFGGDQHSSDEHAAGRIQNTRLFDPATDTNTPIGSPTTDVFCSGHAYLADGRLLVAGGTEEWGTRGDAHHAHGLNFGGERACWLYMPRANTWQRVADLHFEPGRPTGGGRWYPTLVTLGNGEVCAFSGHPSRRPTPNHGSENPPGDSRHNNHTPERYSPSGNFWILLPGGIDTSSGLGTGFYPRVHLLRDGRLFIGTPIAGKNRIYDPFVGTLSGPEIDRPGNQPENLYDGWHATSVLLPLLPNDDYRPRVLIAGESKPQRIDLGDLNLTPSWQPAGSRPGGANPPIRQFNLSVLLPNGQVLVCGGVFQVGTVPPAPVTPELAIMEGELYTPAINWATGTYSPVSGPGSEGSWTATDPASVIRSYHSVALLMPDGRVWVAGSSKKAEQGDPNDSNIAEKRIEIYSPPYVSQPQPTISSAPSFLTYGQPFTIDTPQANTIQRVALMRCGSVTHAFDADQRYVGLQFQHLAGTNTLNVVAPPHGNVAPPGYYMLWIVDTAGNPCQVAAIVRLAGLRCFVLTDRSTFSVHEVEALLSANPQANFERALYVVYEGFLPHEIATLPAVPSLRVTLDSPSGSTTTVITAVPNGGVLWEDPSRPGDVSQRATFAFDVRFSNASVFTGVNQRAVFVHAQMGPYACQAQVTLTNQPNPYMTDGPVEWLSTDVRVFQIKESPFDGAPFGVRFESTDTPYTFIQRQLAHFNTPAGAAAFLSIPEREEDSPLELARTVPVEVPLDIPFLPSLTANVPVYNFAFAKVRFRALTANAPNVRVFFRLFSTVVTSLEYDKNTIYTRHETATTAIPLLGLQGGAIISFPCFAAPRVTPSQSMLNQSDPLNVHTLEPAGANEFIWHYGCHLDINQPEPHFPRFPPGPGPFALGDSLSIQQLVADLHHCLVAEVHFKSPDPLAPELIPPLATPGSSDKLSQRNVTIVHSANPGTAASRTIQHTFEVKPSSSSTPIIPFSAGFGDGFFLARQRMGPDELIFTWNNLPVDSVVTLYMPSVNSADILRILGTRQGPSVLKLIDAHTIQCRVGDITYVPLPGGRSENIPGLLSIELPAGVQDGQLFKVSVQQYSGFTRRIIGAFQLNIPVRHASALLRLEIHRLSLLRYIFQTMPTTDRWHPIFVRYLGQVADRVREFGGDPGQVAPSPHGTGSLEEEECGCRMRWLTPAILAPTLVLLGTLPGRAGAAVAAFAIVLLVAALCWWRIRCPIKACDFIHALLIGFAIGGVVLGIAGIVRLPGVLTALAVSGVLTGALAIAAVLLGCWGKCWCSPAPRKLEKPEWARVLRLASPPIPSDIQTRQEPRTPPKPKPIQGADISALPDHGQGDDDSGGDIVQSK